MWIKAVQALAGTLGLAAIVAAAPALSVFGNAETCGITTVYVTTAPASTIYVTVPTVSYVELSEQQTTTVVLTETVPASSTGPIGITPSVPVYETVQTIVTDVLTEIYGSTIIDTVELSELPTSIQTRTRTVHLTSITSYAVSTLYITEVGSTVTNELGLVTTYPPQISTSTIYETTVITISSCAPEVTNCPYATKSAATTSAAQPSSSTGAISSSIESTPPSTSTIYETTLNTISACAPEVTDCPYTTKPITVASTTLVGYLTEEISVISSSSSTAPESIETIYETTLITISSCAPEVTNCPYRTKPVTITTSFLAISSSGAFSVTTGTPNSVNTEIETVSNVTLYPTSSGGIITYTETPTYSILLNYVVQSGTTSSLPGQTPVPSQSPAAVTSTITVIPIPASATSLTTEVESTLTFQSTLLITTQITVPEIPPSGSSTGSTLSNVTLTAPATSTSSNSPISSQSSNSAAFTTSTVYTTSVYTITSCAPTVTDCPARKGSVTTEIIALYTTICPVTAASSTLHVVPSGGWNSTTVKVGQLSSAKSHVGGVTASKSSKSGVVHISHPTPSFSLYPTSTPLISLPSLAAESGFTASLAASSEGPECTTAVINGYTITLGSASSTIAVGAVNTSSSLVATSSSSPSSVLPLSNLTSETFAATSSNSAVSASSALSSFVTIYSSSSSSVGNISIVVSTSTSTTELTSSLVYNSASSSLVSSSSVSPVLPTFPPFTGIPTSNASPESTFPPVYGVPPVSSVSSGPIATNSSSPQLTSDLAYPSSTISPTQSTTSSSSPSATPSLCGEYGNFTLDFDDIPPLAISPNVNPNTVQPEPIFNPYYQFIWSDGFVVVPPPSDPYLPTTGTHLLEFIPNFNINGTNPQAGPDTDELGYSGAISDGDSGLTGCFNFNFYGAFFGCDSTGPPCDFTFTGFRLVNGDLIELGSEPYTVSSCPALANCTLQPVTFTDQFQNLTSLRINVTVASQPKIWWMDSLNLGWFDNSCTTGLCRQNAHVP